MTIDQPPTPPAPEESGLTRVAEDFLKAIWSATEWGGAPITGRALAERFGTTPASVSDTLRRLATQGLLIHEPYQPVSLTEAGERHAVAMVRKHRLIEAFLVRTLGYSWEEVHDEAENLEHAVSTTMIERIDTLLGHPTRDPHGDPIPRVDGTTPHPSQAINLAEAAHGIYEVTRISDDDPGLLRLLARHGLRPGSIMDASATETRGSVALTPHDGGAQVVLLPEAARALWVIAVS